MKRLLILLLCAFLCTSCTALPAEERAFAVVLGVSRSGEKWTAHARIPTYQTGGGYATISGDGDSLAAAMAALDAASPVHLHLGQLRMLIFSDALAQTADLNTALNELSARHDLRLQTAVAVTDVPMQTLMDAMKPATGSRLSKSIDIMLETRMAQGVTLQADLADILRMGERQSPVLMAVTVKDKELSIEGGYPVSQQGMTGELLSPEEIQLLSLLMGEMTSGTLTIPDGTVRLMDAGSRLALDSSLGTSSCQLTLRYTSSSLTEEALEHSVAMAALAVLNKLAAANCDALGLGRQAIMYADDMPAWHEIDWPTLYPQIEWTVSVGAQSAA
ncbi:MAG: hypothetical protein IJ438_12490 [Clostridia bacterium]|nr:hypothetical protein [Clostridia bacterium]